MRDNWKTFRWRLADLPATEPSLDPFTIRGAEPDEASVVARTILTAFSQDLGWSEDSRVYLEGLEAKCATAFSVDPALCIVIQHGARIIAASLLSAAPDAANHLLTGPSVLHEYRSRGIGSVLLQASLSRLRDEGLEVARGLIPTVSPAARFVYPKFGGVAESLRVESAPIAA